MLFTAAILGFPRADRRAEQVIREDISKRERNIRESQQTHIREMSRHLYSEILYDLLQLSVIAWCVAELPLEDEDFEWKKCFDFLNILSTFIDIIIIKGPTAAALVDWDPQKMNEALASELEPLANVGQLADGSASAALADQFEAQGLR